MAKEERLTQSEKVNKLHRQIANLEAVIKQHAVKLLATRTETQRSGFSMLEMPPHLSNRPSEDDNLSFEKLKRDLSSSQKRNQPAKQSALGSAQTQAKSNLLAVSAGPAQSTKKTRAPSATTRLNAAAI